MRGMHSVQIAGKASYALMRRVSYSNRLNVHDGGWLMLHGALHVQGH